MRVHLLKYILCTHTDCLCDADRRRANNRSICADFKARGKYLCWCISNPDKIPELMYFKPKQSTCADVFQPPKCTSADVFQTQTKYPCWWFIFLKFYQNSCAGVGLFHTQPKYLCYCHSISNPAKIIVMMSVRPAETLVRLYCKSCQNTCADVFQILQNYLRWFQILPKIYSCWCISNPTKILALIYLKPNITLMLEYVKPSIIGW